MKKYGDEISTLKAETQNEKDHLLLKLLIVHS
jgi:hypothetical protein